MKLFQGHDGTSGLMGHGRRVTLSLLAGLSLIGAERASAFQVLTDINTLQYEDLTANGTSLTTQAGLLKCNGTYSVGLGNTDLTQAEMIQVYQSMGPGYTMSEDPIWWTDGTDTQITTGSAQIVAKTLAGYLNAGVWYTEPADNWQPTQAGGTTTADAPTTSLIINSCHANGLNSVNGIVVLTRSYEDDNYWRPPIDAALTNAQVSGIEVEASPVAAVVPNWSLGLLAQKTLAANKNFYLLMPPGGQWGSGTYDYGAQVQAYAAAFRSYVNIADPRIFFIPAIYGNTLGVTWFGATNSIQEAILNLKAQAEWEPPMVPGLYTLTPGVSSSLRLTASGTANGSLVTVATSGGGTKQKWTASATGTGSFKLVPSSSTAQALDVYAAGTANNTQIDTWGANGTAAQQWFITPNINKSYTLSPACAQASALDIPGGSTKSGTATDLYQQNGTAAQQWTFTVTK